MRELKNRNAFDELPNRDGVRAAIIWLFDAISIEFLDRLPNTITVLAIVALIACCQGGVVLVLRLSDLIQDALASMAIVVAATVCVTIPIVGFGQMQYRRARQAYFDTIRLAKELTDARDAHVSYGVEPVHYTYVDNALLRTLAKGLGEQFTPELREAWIEAYGTLADIMKEAAYGNSSGWLSKVRKSG